jgi:hypothetical protein
MQSALPALPQRTGQTSSQIAQSFQATPIQQQAPQTARKASARIPNIRLSFITVQDQAKFEQLFKSAVGESQALSGRHAPAVGFQLNRANKKLRGQGSRPATAFQIAGRHIVADMVCPENIQCVW